MNKSAIGIVAGVMLAGWVLAGEHPEHPKTNAPATAETAGKLDGKAFAGELVKKGEKKGDKDEFVFKQGKFVSTACVAYGFNEAPYVATEKDGTITFTSEPKNAKEEKMSWKGAVKNNEIEGTAVHTAGKSQTEYWFKGTLKKAEGSGTKTEGSSTKAEHPKKSEHPEHPK